MGLLTPTVVSREGLLYKMIVAVEGFELCLRCLSKEVAAVTDEIDSHITISYFSVVDPYEIILDEEDINDPFIHVNMKEIGTCKEHMQQ